MQSVRISSVPPSTHRSRHSLFRLALLPAGVAFLLPFCGEVAAATGDPSPVSPSSNEKLISRLPDPSQFSKSPLENVAEDPTEKTPEYAHLVADMRRRDLNGALKEARALAARYPDSHAKVHLLRGALGLLAKQYADAEAGFHIYNTLMPKAGIGWTGLAVVARLRGRKQEALADARQATSIDPALQYGWIMVATCEIDQHHLPEATVAARRAVQTNPRSAVAWYALGRCEAFQHNFSKATDDLRHSADLSPNTLPIQGTLAVCAIEAGRTADAIPPLETVVNKAPNDVVACVKLAYCYMVTGKVAQGADVCRRAVRVQPRYSAAWDMLGQCYHRAGKNREALDAFQHAVSLTPGDLNYRTRLDEARQAAGQS